jgi:hypothetical protein
LPDLPQGLSKKIEFDLLLADLALKFGNTFWRAGVASRNIARPLLHPRCDDVIALARSTQRPERFRSTRPEQFPPCIEILAQHRQLF